MKNFFTNLFIALAVAGVGWVVSVTVFMSDAEKKQLASEQFTWSGKDGVIFLDADIFAHLPPLVFQEFIEKFFPTAVHCEAILFGEFLIVDLIHVRYPNVPHHQLNTFKPFEVTYTVVETTD